MSVTYAFAHNSVSSFAILTDGRIAEVWRDGQQIRTTVFNANGTVAVADSLVGSLPAGMAADAFQYDVAALADGGYAVAWVHYVPPSSSYYPDVKLNLYSVTGAATTSDIPVNIYADYGQNDPNVTQLPDGRIFVSWTDIGLNPVLDKAAARGRFFSAEGTPLGDEIQLHDDLMGLQGVPAAAGLSDGGIAIGYVDDGSILNDGADGDVYVTILNANGSPRILDVVVSEAAGHQSDVSLAAFSFGRFVVFWQDAAVAGAGRIKGQAFAADGTRLGAAFVVDEAAGGNQLRPDLEIAPSGAVRVFWTNQTTGAIVSKAYTLGFSGADVLFGSAGDDVMPTGSGADTLSGGLGNDTYATNGGDVIIERANAGLDLVNSSASHTLRAHLEHLVLTGNAPVNGRGNGLNNQITGNAAGNALNGDAGADTLSGRGGADSLVGGLGKDLLKGGVDAARDVFVFDSVSESGIGGARRDVIQNFASGVDVIRLSGIDANTALAGNQAFAFNGARSKANGVWFTDIGDDLIVKGDTNGDRIADFELQLAAISALGADDFLL